MRRKPLNNNPNSMHMIMENFRRFQNVLDDMGGPADNKVYLFESNNSVPTVVLLDEIERKFDSKKLTEKQLESILEKSWLYEVQEFNRIYKASLLKEQEVPSPGIVNKLSNIVNKGVNMFGRFVKKAKNVVWKVMSWIFKLVVKFKTKFPTLFKIVVAGLVILALVAIATIVVNYLEKLRNKSEAAGDQPLCTQAIGAVTEVEGKCIVAGEVLSEGDYQRAMGFLEEAKGGVDKAEAQAYTQAQASLTACYNAAKRGEVVDLNDFRAVFEYGDTASLAAVKVMREQKQEYIDAVQTAKQAKADWEAAGEPAMGYGEIKPEEQKALEDAYDNTDQIYARLDGYKQSYEQAKAKAEGHIEWFESGKVGDHPEFGAAGAGAEAAMNATETASMFEKIFKYPIGDQVPPQIEVLSDEDILEGVKALMEKRPNPHGPTGYIPYVQKLTQALRNAGRDDLIPKVVEIAR
tara:strand:- start:131 stop:1519 length:1389 start_codon:yes stop_codon:yes gene_type:complete